MINTHDKIDFSRFGKKFQESLCRIVLDDREFCDQVFEVLKVEFFEVKYLQLFVQVIVDYKREFGTHPSRDIVATILRSGIEDESDVLKKQVRDYFTKLMTTVPDFEGDTFIKKKALDFCRKQNLKEAMIKSAKLIHSASFEEISKIINDSLKLGSNTDFGYDYLKDFEKRYEVKFRRPITTGWKQVDAITGGGLGKGELGVVVAPTGAGKSMALVHLAAQALKQGKTVVYYTLELEDTVVAKRFDSCLTGVHLTDLNDMKEVVLEKVRELNGHLIVKEYPTKSANVNKLKQHLEKLRRSGFEPDLICVDYGDLLQPISSYKEKRIELETIYEDLRGMAQEFECPVWTASQTNRSGLNAEVVTMESISEAFNKCFVADLIFTLSRTITDKNNNTGRIFVAKNRNGPDGIVYPIFMDTSNIKIDVLPSTGETAEEINDNAAKKQQESLQEKYKKFRNGGKT